MGATKTRSLYDVHPGVAMVRKWVDELKSKTGRSLEEWIALMKKEGPKGEKERREWLKIQHKLGTNSTWWIAERADWKGGDEDSPEAYLKAAVRYVEEQYAGPKEKLRPIYDRAAGIGQEERRRCEGLSLQDDGAVVSESCVCADQADDEYARGFRVCAGEVQGEIAEAVDRYGRIGEEGSDYASDRDYVGGRD